MSSTSLANFCVAILVVFFAAFSNVHSGHKKSLNRPRLLNSRNSPKVKYEDDTIYNRTQRQHLAGNSEDDVEDSSALYENVTDSTLDGLVTNFSSVSRRDNVTDSVLDNSGTNVSSVSPRENVTDSSFTIQGENTYSQDSEGYSESSPDHQFNNTTNSSSADVAIDNTSNISNTNYTPDTNISNTNSTPDTNISSTNYTLHEISNNATSPDTLGETLTYLKEDINESENDESLSTHSSQEDENDTDYDQIIETGCVACRIRSIDRHYRILQFKNQILNSLHLTNLPNTTGVPVPKFPALTHLYEMDADLMSDSPRRNGHGTDNIEYEDDIVVKTERLFIAVKEAPLALHLNMTDSVYFPPAVQLFTSEIKSAYLWFYIQKHHTPPSHVSIESILPHTKPGRNFITKKVFSFKLSKERAFGWKRVDIRETLSQWIRHPMTNFGLIIKAENIAGKNLIVLPPASDVDKGYEPWLDTKIVEPKHNSRRRRSESLMCVENSTDTRCCRHPLLVGFAEFGWDWIIAPTHVNADYCTGECRMTMQDHTPYSWVNQQTAGSSSCCTPTKLSPLPLLYFDESMNIVYQILQNMKVDKCGCT